VNCEKAEKKILLFAGGELPEKKARNLSKHLEECEDCREELREYKAALASLKSLAPEEDKDWAESDWQNLMKKVATEKIPRRPLLFLPGSRIAWGYGLLLFLIMGVGVLFFRSIFRKPSAARPLTEITLTRVQQSRTFKPAETRMSGQVQDSPFSVKTRELELSPGEVIIASSHSLKKPSQDQLSVTLVSQETGLRVYWTFDKNFNWKEE
jgi:anti-sigma factor RsiW